MTHRNQNHDEIVASQMRAISEAVMKARDFNPLRTASGLCIVAVTLAGSRSPASRSMR